MFHIKRVWSLFVIKVGIIKQLWNEPNNTVTMRWFLADCLTLFAIALELLNSQICVCVSVLVLCAAQRAPSLFTARHQREPEALMTQRARQCFDLCC